MERLTVFLEPIEKNALLNLANKEYRDSRYQAALIIRDELTRCGLLPGDNKLIPVWTEGRKEADYEHAGS